ncbi:hypothetical protein BJ875DRAFT_442404 [Amylocarpus encephaloides]|uniref:Uncharacterized protein n=1 Tax=Amylocarpus encephaloides TaxID=45428 RepID=A0A9P7YHU1_9HELO|nr:hypothetical protein BJ875DRAFT_442404 [Amylocarpus encephaloides]
MGLTASLIALASGKHITAFFGQPSSQSATTIGYPSEIAPIPQMDFINDEDFLTEDVYPSNSSSSHFQPIPRPDPGISTPGGIDFARSTPMTYMTFGNSPF